jgi:O-antigen/teichoic acid export membrane protein
MKLVLFQNIWSKLKASGFLKSSILVSFSKVVSSLANLIFMIYSVNILSKSENGYFQYYLGFLPVILAIAELGIPSAVVKYLSPKIDNIKEIGNILSASLLIKLLAFLLLCLGGILTSLIFSLDNLIMFMLIIGGTITSFLTFFESIIVSHRDYKILALWNPLGNITKLVILYFADKFIDTPLTYIDILGIFSLSPIFIIILFFFLYSKKDIKWTGSKEGIHDKFKELTLFNLWAFAASIFAIVSDRLEIFFLKKYHTAELVAVYGTSLQLFSGFVIIFSTLNSLVFPRLSMIQDPEEFKKFLLKSILVAVSIAVLLSPGYLLAEPILNFLFNNKYSDSIPVFKILYPNYLLQLVFAPLGIALFAMGRPKILAMLAFIRLIFGLLFDNLLIPEMGVMGAGISFFLGQIVSWLVLVGYFWAILFSK